MAESRSGSLVGSAEATASSLPEPGSPAPIWILARDCITGYQTLYDHLQAMSHDQASIHAFDRDVVLANIQDARAHFQAWATNTAVLQEAHLKSSLDSRIREMWDATGARELLTNILEDLKEYLHDAALIVTGEEANETCHITLSDTDFDPDFGYDSDDSNFDKDTGRFLGATIEEPSRLDTNLAAIKGTKSNLMSVSHLIRWNFLNRDDYAKAEAHYSLDPCWDIGHVQERFGSAKQSSDWLIQRLGKSITRRRQYLLYRKEYHGAISQYWSESPEDVPEIEEDVDPEKTIALTKETPFVEAKVVAQKDGSEVGSFGTETSYDQTVAGETQELRLAVPGPPTEAFEGVPFAFGEPFQCPYCYTEQNVKNRNAWKKHVFSDLTPYVCTFRDCGQRMYRSRNEWFTHELQQHRREWICPHCDQPFPTKSGAKAHLGSQWPFIEESLLERIVSNIEVPMYQFPASACTLCDEWEEELRHPEPNEGRAFPDDGKDVEPYGTQEQLRSHLGRHMEQLALFSLPRSDETKLNDDADDKLAGDACGVGSDGSTGAIAPDRILASTSRTTAVDPPSDSSDSIAPALLELANGTSSEDTDDEPQNKIMQGGPNLRKSSTGGDLESPWICCKCNKIMTGIYISESLKCTRRRCEHDRCLKCEIRYIEDSKSEEESCLSPDACQDIQTGEIKTLQRLYAEDFIQDNNLDAIAAIYGDDFQKIKANEQIEMKPRHMEIQLRSSDKNVTFTLDVVLLFQYPNTAPLFRIRDAGTLPLRTIDELQEVIRSIIGAFVARKQPMILTIIDSCREVLERMACLKAVRRKLAELAEICASGEPSREPITASLRAPAIDYSMLSVEEQMEYMQSLGFVRADVEEAMQATLNNPNRAIEMLFRDFSVRAQRDAANEAAAMQQDADDRP